MNPSPPPRELFESALQVEPAQRALWLAEHCADPTLRTELTRMLAADARAGEHSIDRSVDRLLEGIGDPASDAPPPGTRVGAFLLHEKLGEGGSSVVFRATREQAGVIQQVALKLLRRNLYTIDEQRRFRDERRALSQLDHSGIARLVEGDVTESGTPYIALELVVGMTIIEHARSRRLDLPQRLRLFVDTCRAVEAAHRALIVHRDLKPSNVLVTEGGQVKLLDFGIAKMLDADGDGHTQTQLQAMTPAYAAPEQFRRGQITTATDVYSLGILLGELVTGQRREHGDSRTPSSQLLHDAEPGVLPATVHRTRRRLLGDLDNIVLQATAEEPARRYASAGALADDIERHLANQPVQAHPPSRLYRTRKFVSRHSGGVVATTLFLIAILAALGAALWQGHLAEHAVLRANAMRGFMFDAFEKAEPGSPQEGPPRITDVVAQAITNARANTRMNVEVRSELLTRLGAVQRAQGQLKPALETLEWNYGKAQAEFGEAGRLTIEAGEELVSTLLIAGDFPRARLLIDRLRPRVSASEPALAARLALDSAELATKLHEKRRALSDAEAGMALARTVDEDEIERGLYFYGNVQLAVNDIEGATRTYEELLAIKMKQFGPIHLRVSTTHADLSRAYRRAGNHAQAEKHIRAALAIDAAVLPKDDARIANHLNALMFVLMMQRDFAQALDVAREGLRINRLVYGPDNFEVANDFNSIGMLSGMLGNDRDAIEPLRESLRICELKYGKQAYETAWAHTNYGAALSRVGEVARGESEMSLALEIYAAEKERDFDQEARAWEKLARSRLDRHDANALQAIDRVDSSLAHLPSPGHYWDGRAAVLRASGLLDGGRAHDALLLLDAAIAESDASPTPDRDLGVEALLLQAAASRRVQADAMAAALAAKAADALEHLRNPPQRLLALAAGLQELDARQGDEARRR